MGYLPAKETDLAAFALNFAKYGEDNAARLKFDAAELAELKRLAEDFDAKLKVAGKPGHSALDVAAKNTAHKALTHALREFVQGRVNHNAAVTDADRVGMGLPQKDTVHTPSEGTDRRVVATLEAALRQITVHYRDEESQHRGKPEGIHGCELRRQFLEKPPEHIDELVHSEFSTASPFVLDFDEADRGKHLYIALRWETTRAEKGVWSPIYDIYIP